METTTVKDENSTANFTLFGNVTLQPLVIIDIPILYVVNTFATVLVNPIIALFGITGNILSIIVLVKSGFSKPSNVLLSALCVADTFVLIAALNIPRFTAFLPGKKPNHIALWEYSETECFILYVLTIIIHGFYIYGVKLSATIVTLITLERFIAVFFPLKFVSIVTTKRAWLSVILAYVIWLPWPLYNFALYQFSFQYFKYWDLYAGSILIYYDDLFVMTNLNVVIPLGLYMPFILVTLGSLLIATKVKVTLEKRQALVSAAAAKSAAKSSKTTRTLLTVCLVFSITKFASILEYFMDFVHQNGDYIANRDRALALTLIIFFLDNVCSASNFFIYVALNKKFRNSLRESICLLERK
ncbi:neuropeptides capa receptor [Biomphalaria pfeifferi]|uniref:Neuropeptides capa receptor n=1 Tax=Biomphalaria pfeifferi TaxID=112525 RepID=A0AAD8EZZ5_BIOPF|nr:neuropeptides capa receptor [Biomphalaria pfeifferi]